MSRRFGCDGDSAIYNGIIGVWIIFTICATDVCSSNWHVNRTNSNIIGHISEYRHSRLSTILRHYYRPIRCRILLILWVPATTTTLYIIRIYLPSQSLSLYFSFSLLIYYPSSALLALGLSVSLSCIICSPLFPCSIRVLPPYT